MKTALTLVGLIIIVAIAYYVFVAVPAEAPTMETETSTNSGSQAKLDINVVCDGALAYMSFPSGTEADAWVAACKRGEHPEAIEQYKTQMGIQDDRAI